MLVFLRLVNCAFIVIQYVINLLIVVSDGVSHGHVDVIIDDPCLDGYKNFRSEGKVSVPYESETVSPVTILRDTGASQSLMLKSVLPKLSDIPSKSCVLVKGFGCETYVSIPLHTITMVSDLVSGDVSIGVVSQLPVDGIDMLLGNHLAGAKVIVEPHMSVEPVDSNDNLEYMFPSAFPSCVVTRSMTKKDDIDLNSTFLANDEILTSMSDNVSKHVVVKDIQPSDHLQSLNKVSDKMSKIDQLRTEQRSDESINKLFDMAVSERESNDVPVCYVKSDVLMRKWRPVDVPAYDDWHVVNQIVVPKCYGSEIVKIAHEFPTGGHVGVKKDKQSYSAIFLLAWNET